MYSEEILVKLGIDKSGLSNGLKQSTADVAAFKSSTISQLREIKHEMKDLKLIAAGGGLFTIGLHLATEAYDKVSELINSAATAAETLMQNMDAVRSKTLDIVASIRKTRQAEDSPSEQLVSESDTNERLQREEQAARIRYNLKKLEAAEQIKIEEEARKQAELDMEIARRGGNYSTQSQEKAYQAAKKVKDLDAELANLLNERLKATQNIEESNKRIADLQTKIQAEDQKQREEDRKRAGDAVISQAKSELEIAKQVTAERATQLSLVAKSAELHAKQSNIIAEKTNFTVAELAKMDPRRVNKGSDLYDDIFDAKRIQQLESDAKDPTLSQEDRVAAFKESRKLRKGLVNATPSEISPDAELDNQTRQADISAGVGAQGMAFKGILGFNILKPQSKVDEMAASLTDLLKLHAEGKLVVKIAEDE